MLGQALRLLTSAAPPVGVLPAPLVAQIDRSRSSLSQEQLATYLDHRASQWLNVVVELLERLSDDWDLLTKQYELDPPAELVAVSEPLGDLHNHGRSVFRVQFANGRSLIYKPRPIDAEWGFGELLDWCADRQFPLELTYSRALRRNGYGWTANIEVAPCSSEDEAKAYYRRQGGFMALFWLLCAEDATSDNVLVCGCHPIWIDTECICQPDVPYSFSSVRSMPDWIKTSVVTTGMIASGGRGAAQPFRNAGLNVCCVKDRIQIYSAENGMRPPYAKEVIRGFHEVYSWALAQRQSWLSDNPLMSASDLRVRVLLRSTGFYSVLVALLAAVPEAGTSEIQTDVEEVLRAWDGHGHWSARWPHEVVQAEMAALRRGDVPYWTALTSTRDLQEADSSLIRDVSRVSGLERLARRAQQLSMHDLERQVWLIESFLSRPGA